jgi:4-diphosphocytidyl-2-C-methyl-D-erythritol kinase
VPHRRLSPCKVNFLLNILGKRPDGFHELETLFFPVPLHDEIAVEETASEGIILTCSNAELPCDRTNLVHRAAEKYLSTALIKSGVRLHLEKRLPLAAGLGGGSANAAVTLLALNEMFGGPLTFDQLDEIAASLGSDVNFFLQPNPALAGGRGEKIVPLAPFTALAGTALFLFRPCFGVATPWAFKELARFPEALNGRPGRAAEVAEHFRAGDLVTAGRSFFNSLEAPVLEKYPVLALCQDFLRELGALGALMSGSGSTTFALFPDLASAQAAVVPFRAKFGETGWLQVVAL